VRNIFKKIALLRATDIYAESYEYKFTPTCFGQEDLNVVITDEDGNVAEGGFGVYADQ